MSINITAKEKKRIYVTSIFLLLPTQLHTHTRTQKYTYVAIISLITLVSNTITIYVYNKYLSLKQNYLHV